MPGRCIQLFRYFIGDHEINAVKCIGFVQLKIIAKWVIFRIKGIMNNKIKILYIRFTVNEGRQDLRRFRSVIYCVDEE